MTVDLRRHFLQQELVVFLYDLIDRGLRLGWVLLVDTGPLPQMALTTIRWSWNRGSPYQDQCGSESGSSQEAVIGDHDAVQDRRKQEMHGAKKYYRPLEGGPDRYLWKLGVAESAADQGSQADLGLAWLGYAGAERALLQHFKHTRQGA